MIPFVRLRVFASRRWLGQDSLTRYTLGDPSSATVIYTNNQVFDVKTLASGNLFVASAYAIAEITDDGSLVRNIPLRDASGDWFVDVRGIEYDPITNDLFVTHLGYTNFYFQLMRVNATTGELEKNVYFHYGDDLFLDLAGDVLVGSRTMDPTFFTHDLDQMGTLSGGQQMFVTRFLLWPTIENMPADITAEATGPGGATINFALPSSTDFEGNPNIIVSQPAPGAMFPITTTQVTCTAIDRQSHTTSVTFNVTLQDTTAPTIQVPANIRVTQKRKKNSPAEQLLPFP